MCASRHLIVPVTYISHIIVGEKKRQDHLVYQIRNLWDLIAIIARGSYNI